MGATDVDQDVATLTRDLIDNQWDSDNAVKPEYIELVTENEKGEARKRVRRNNEYFLFADQSERTYDYPDLGWNARTMQVQCYLELSTADSRQRREELLSEVERIAVAHRTRPDTPDTWDNLQFKPTVIDDETFGWWTAEVTFTYTKRMEVI